MLLTHKGADIDYVRVSYEEWGARKAAGPVGEFGGMPIVTQKDDIPRQQTNAVLRKLGIENGYYDPSDWKAAGKIDMIVETYGDVFNAFAKIAMGQSDDETKAADIEALKAGSLTKFLNIVEKQIESQPTSKFLVGSSVTIADFVMGCLFFNFMKNEHGPFSTACSSMFSQYPHVGAYSKRLESELKTYLTNRTNYPF